VEENKRYKMRKGLSAIELIISASILCIIGVVAISVLTLSIRGERVSVEEFALQSSTRLLMDDITYTVRYATAVFILPESSFNSTSIDTSLDFIPASPEGFLTEGWNYYGIIDNVVLRYIWNEVDNGHRRVELFVGANEGLEYGLRFFQIDPMDMDDTLVQFHLEVTRDGLEESEIDILTAADSLNSMQVVDWSTEVNPGRAIAYRMDELPRTTPVARVVLILDVSGSMRELVNSSVRPANWAANPNVRMTILREVTQSLLTTFSEIENIELTIIPYSTTANFGRPSTSIEAGMQPGMNQMQSDFNALFTSGQFEFLSVYENLGAFRQVASNLYPSGETNIADGLRRAYTALRDAPPDPLGREIIEFVILMTDGQPNAATMVTSSPNHTFLTERTTLPLYRGAGNINVTGTNRRATGNILDNATVTTSIPLAGGNNGSRAYRYVVRPVMQYWGNNILSRTDSTFYVVFSTTVVNNAGEVIGDAADLIDILQTHDTTYTAVSYYEMLYAFENIAASIITDLWHASGPNLEPPSSGTP